VHGSALAPPKRNLYVRHASITPARKHAVVPSWQRMPKSPQRVPTCWVCRVFRKRPLLYWTSFDAHGHAVPAPPTLKAAANPHVEVRFERCGKERSKLWMSNGSGARSSRSSPQSASSVHAGVETTTTPNSQLRGGWPSQIV